MQSVTEKTLRRKNNNRTGIKKRKQMTIDTTFKLLKIIVDRNASQRVPQSRNVIPINLLEICVENIIISAGQDK